MRLYVTERARERRRKAEGEPMSEERSAEKGTHVCGKCGKPVRQVDLYGTPFFTHKPRRDCLTWWHIDQARNFSHQAVRGRPMPPEVTP
jgi:hypothetical protein